MKWFLILALGLSLRLLLTTTASLNFDMHMFRLNTDLFMQGKYNIYLYNWGYNYAPAFFYVSGWLESVNRALLGLPYQYIQRLYITAIDVGTLIVLIALAKKLNLPVVRTALFFFLNPVTILVSGYHGQFDNNAVFLLILAVWFYFYSGIRLKLWAKVLMAWVLLTAGLIIKHIIPFQIFLVEISLFRKHSLIKGTILFALTALVFGATFIPYYTNPDSRYVINQYVLGYQGMATISGVTGFIRYVCLTCELFGIRWYTLYKYVFMASGMLFPLLLGKQHSILRRLLASFLFFLAFSSGHTAQYFILPIALGALFPTRWFFVYTAVVTVYLLAFQIEVGVSLYIKLLLLNLAWLASVLWFISETRSIFIPAIAGLFRRAKK